MSDFETFYQKVRAAIRQRLKDRHGYGHDIDEWPAIKDVLSTYPLRFAHRLPGCARDCGFTNYKHGVGCLSTTSESTPPRLREYLHVEAEMMNLDAQNDPRADEKRDLLDRLWAGLSDDELRALDARGMMSTTTAKPDLFEVER